MHLLKSPQITLSDATTGALALLFTRPTDDSDRTPLEQGAIEVLRNNERGIVIKKGTDGSVMSIMDYRIKSNVATIDNASSVINKLRPVTYDTAHKTGYLGFVAHELQEHVPQAVIGTKDATEAIGTLSDWDGTELATGVTEPEELTYEEQVEAAPYVAAVAATYDEEGNELTPAIPEVEPTYETVTRTRSWAATGTQDLLQGVDESKLIPLLTRALQEVMQKNEDLEARIAALEGA